ncbi:MAG TPA: DUF4279 domain-containing protein, partial [Acidimicrobiales bacterium]|nr:DUF4279 domain-containing protein [Acidimicrobiales bacterium]
MAVGTSRTYATFRMFKDDLDPDAVTTELGITPTRSFRRGDRRPTAPTLYPRGGWLLSTRSDNIDDPDASR